MPWTRLSPSRHRHTILATRGALRRNRGEPKLSLWDPCSSVDAVILVDAITEYPKTELRHTRWSHMVSTESQVELLEMAERLGLKRAWLQRGGGFVHFDVTPPKRALAIHFGAREVSSRLLLFANYDYAIKRPGKMIPEPYRTEIEKLHQG
jgi:hypothetical protein